MLTPFTNIPLLETFDDCTDLLYQANKNVNGLNNNNSLLFSDVKVIRDTNMFVTSVYCKPTFGGYLHFCSEHTLYAQIGTLLAANGEEWLSRVIY